MGTVLATERVVRSEVRAPISLNCFVIVGVGVVYNNDRRWTAVAAARCGSEIIVA